MAKKPARGLADTALDRSALEDFVDGGPGIERDVPKAARTEPKRMGRPKKERKVDLVKATFYLRPDHLILLDKIRLKRIEDGAERGEVDKSSLVREAIEILAKQHKI